MCTNPAYKWTEPLNFLHFCSEINQLLEFLLTIFLSTFGNQHFFYGTSVNKSQQEFINPTVRSFQMFSGGNMIHTIVQVKNEDAWPSWHLHTS